MCIVAICLVFSQDASGGNVENLRLRESEYTFGNSTRNASSDTTQDSSSASSESGSTASTVWLFVRMILVLVLVIACIYAIVWLLKKSMRPGAENDPYLKKTASITLSPGKTVQIVTLQDKAYLLGVSDSSITLISEITDKELVDAMNLNAPMSNGKKPADFASLLTSLTSSAKRTESFLKSRREKIGGGEGKR